jgi:hypothetical protein
VTWNFSPFVFSIPKKTGGNLTCGPSNDNYAGNDNGVDDGGNEVNDDGDGATGNDNDDDDDGDGDDDGKGDGAMGSGATGYDNDDDGDW